MCRSIMENPLVSRSSPLILSSLPLPSNTSETLRVDWTSYADPWVGIPTSGTDRVVRGVRRDGSSEGGGGGRV